MKKTIILLFLLGICSLPLFAGQQISVPVFTGTPQSDASTLTEIFTAKLARNEDISIAAGGNASAEYSIKGNITTISGTGVLSIQLIDTATGRIIYGSETAYSSISELLDKMDVLVKETADSITQKAGPSGPLPTPLPVAQPAAVPGDTVVRKERMPDGSIVPVYKSRLNMPDMHHAKVKLRIGSGLAQGGMVPMCIALAGAIFSGGFYIASDDYLTKAELAPWVALSVGTTITAGGVYITGISLTKSADREITAALLKAQQQN